MPPAFVTRNNMSKRIIIFLILIALPVLTLGQNNATVNLRCDSTFDIKTKFHVYEVMPVYPGGVEAFYKFIADNYKAPEGRDSSVKSATVIFEVGTNGSIGTVCVYNKGDLKNLNTTVIGQEILRVFSSMPKWTPAREQGIVVPAQMATTVITE